MKDIQYRLYTVPNATECQCAAIRRKVVIYMAKKKLTLGMAAAAAAGTAVYVAKKSQAKKNQNGTSQNDIRDKANSGWSLTQHKINSGWTFNKKDDRNSAVNNSYRNTER